MDQVGFRMLPAYEAGPELPEDYGPGTAFGLAAHAGWQRRESDESNNVDIQPSGEVILDRLQFLDAQACFLLQDRARDGLHGIPLGDQLE